jgi:predicted dehydrogenase
MGSIGQRHLRNLRALGISDIRLVRHLNRPLADPELLNGIETFTDLDVVLRHKPDAVVISNPTSLHIPTALAAARQDCHLFIEKPLSHVIRGVGELEACVASKKLIAIVAYQMRFHPGLTLIHDLLIQEKIGRVLSVRVEVGQYLPDWHKGEDYRTGYSSSLALGGGVTLDLSHEIDYINWLFGPVHRICCMGGKYSTLEIETEDVVEILMECERAPIVEIHLDYLQRIPSRTCQIIGSEGTIRWDYFASRVEIYSTKIGHLETYCQVGFERNQMYLDAMAHFLRCLEGKERPMVTLADGRAALELALLAKQSSRDGQTYRVTALQEDFGC